MAKKNSNVELVGTSVNTEAIVKAMTELSQETDSPMSQKTASEAIRLLRTAVFNALEKGQKVQLTGFMALSPSYRAPRKGNNVLTGKEMDIPESVVISAKVGSTLKDATKNFDGDMIKAVKNLKK